MSNLTLSRSASVSIPAHLRPYVVDQEYAKYTPINQAVWRYVLRQNSAFLAEKGHGSYRDGLRDTGMSTESIPSVEEMTAQLATLGWSAVAVDGFIPPVAFFDFQARGILPIAGDIRTLDHIAYTPAPDIIHESAGHAPMLADRGYAEFVKSFGAIGAKALSSREDLAVYEAIRLISILKEDPTATEAQITEAESNLDAALAAVTHASEATQLSRLYWWTVEYGLIGDLHDPKIYGAGLLSSMGESRSCLAADVVKLPFDLDACINTDFNITKPQPQLFVCRDFDQLQAAVNEFATRMAYKVGGTVSLQKALASANTATMVYSSGLQVSGTLTDLVLNAGGEAIYLKTTGPTALAHNNRELPGHDQAYHAEGFGSPIGKLSRFDTPLESMNAAQLQAAGIVENKLTTLEFASGITVHGLVKRIVRADDKIILISLDDCTVSYGDQELFRSEWGTFDMAVGATIDSVYAGAADPETFFGSTQASPNKTHRPTYSDTDLILHSLYQSVRDLRQSHASEGHTLDVVEAVLEQLKSDFPHDWLLRLELLEILTDRRVAAPLQARLFTELQRLAHLNDEHHTLIENGLKLLP